MTSEEQSTMRTEAEMQASLYAVVKVALQELDRGELAAQLLTQQLGGDPRQRLGYAKIKHLFTEQDGTKMHDETRHMFLIAANAILFPAETEAQS